MNKSIMPKHIAIIMDGNRRWAKDKKLPSLLGHKKGQERIEKIVEHAKDLGIEYITFWAFSTENWKRSEQEVTYLMDLFKKMLRGKLFKKLIKKGVKICVLGDISAFSEELRKEIERVVEESKNNTSIQVNIALNYGGREELTHAVKQIISDNICQTEITTDLISQYLYTRNQPDPDLIIRTGGAQRLSGYLPWQSIYSELYFTDTYWPDFDKQAFDRAIEEYERRERRFGR